jgi:thioredoxin reductase
MRCAASLSVYYPATPAEALACAAAPVAVVGGGNSAGQAAPFLARSWATSLSNLMVSGAMASHRTEPRGGELPGELDV